MSRLSTSAKNVDENKAEPTATTTTSTATSATTTTTSNATATIADPACAPCVKLLQQILAGDGSARPRQLLGSLSPQFVWRPTEDGLEVQIPASVALPQRRWSRLHSLDDDEETRRRQQQQQSSTTTIATSAFLRPKTDESLNNTNSNNNEKNNHNNYFQWMQIICKPCANVGPEAGARAFVMGPTPLSMVVCTNRLYGDSLKDRRAEMEEILTHEFMHVYDVRQLQLDLRDCENLAYSEVRAAREAECYNSWAPQACTRLKAQKATQNLFPKLGGWCIRQVWDTAYKDTRPFDDKKRDEGVSGR